MIRCEFTGCDSEATEELEPLPLPGLSGEAPPMHACRRHYDIATAAQQRRAELTAEHMQRWQDGTETHIGEAEEP